ncbi:MAG: ATP-binding protein [Scytonema sp. PMC 1069.18]|nr:ATP-binding protein [Scytonema sp. PMC 1069.18]MEC4886941.1 ATP-binding protein [Scytonema sp. PMC 1070.18]
MSDPVKTTLPEDIFAGGGEMGQVMRSLDWSKTLLGSISKWPQSLKTTVSILLNSRYPMFVWWGTDYANLYNDAYRPILGASKHPQFLGQSAKVCWAEVWDVVGPLADSVLKTGQSTWSENLLLLMERNGYTEETYFTFSYSPVRDESGGIGGVFCAVTETTEQVIGGRRLRTLRELAANTGEAKTVEKACIIVTDTLSKNLYDIPFALLYLVEDDGKQARLVGTVGVTPKTKAIQERVALTQETDLWNLTQVQRTNEAFLVDDLTTRFGSLPGGIWEASSQQALVIPIAQSGEKQQLAGLLVLGISPRRQFDDEYQGFFDLIANNVGTAIANARSYEEERQRSEALAELDRAKTVFFSNVSHEFRTPLTLMLSPLEEALAVADETPFATQRQQLQMVHRNSLRLLKLVNTLLDFSRIESGRIQAVYEPTDLSTFTSELASVFRSAIEKAGMHLHINCPPLPEPVYVDREMWEKIVLNLLSNAFKFTFEGEITVSLQFQSERIEVSVCDTGIGIPTEELPHLFERFYRVRNSQGRTFEGSGIGLSLVQELVKLHGGTVGVKSVLGEGSCFTVSIPTGYSHLPHERVSVIQTQGSTAIAAAYVEEALRWLPEEECDERTFSSTSARILLIDDNADMRSYVKRLLSQQYEVETVADGVAASAAIARQSPDLILTDVMMPRVDGFELLRSLRSNLATREIPIILLSARAGEESRVEGLQAGADDYLIKPFSARELLARVEANLKMARLRKEVVQREQQLRSQSVASQQAAETANASLEKVLASIKDQFLVLDREWRYTYVNDMVVEVTGIRREDLLGKSIWELFPDIIGSEFYNQAHLAVSNRTPVQFEYFYPTWNRWFENRIYPIDEGLSILVTEITDRKQAETALQRSEERYRAFIEQSSEAIWCFETEIPLPINVSVEEQIQHFYHYCYLAECNQVMAQMYGVSSPSDLMGAKVADLLVKSDPRNLEYLRAFIRSGYRLVDAESYEVDRHGNPKVFLNNLVGIIEDGMLVRAWGNQRDITDRKQAEATLRQSEERYRYLAESIPQLVWTANADGVLIDVNQRWSDYTGLTLAQAQTAGWQEIVHPDDIPTLSQNWAAAQHTGTIYRAEGRMRRADGAYRWHLHQAIPLKNAQGQAIKWFGTATDIENQKQLEQQRLRLLEQEQVARAEAETANRIKDEFLAVLSHELRSPLNPILGWSKLLLKGKLDGTKTTQALQTIERNAKLQAQLIEDLLDVSRILRGKLSLEMAPVNLVSTIEAAKETVRLAAEAKSIQIQTVVDENIGQVLGDSARLQQVMWNLLTNAVKFTSPGGQVTIRLQCIDSQAQVIVSDTGRGIHPDFLPYVFEYFRQADGTTTRKFGGLGLGLAIVHHLVELHGGTVQAESPGEGLGATFTVCLPLLKEEKSRKEGDNSSPSKAETALLTGIQVLVVDDDADTRELITFILEQYGAIVTDVGSAVEALEAIAKTQPDVLISDIGMPEMDGYTLMRQIRAMQSQQNHPLRAIALTAYAGEINQQQAIAAGFQHHIAKPVDPEQLVEVITKMLNVKPCVTRPKIW